MAKIHSPHGYLRFLTGCGITSTNGITFMRELLLNDDLGHKKIERCATRSAVAEVVRLAIAGTTGRTRRRPGEVAGGVPTGTRGVTVLARDVLDSDVGVVEEMTATVGGLEERVGTSVAGFDRHREHAVVELLDADDTFDWARLQHRPSVPGKL